MSAERIKGSKSGTDGFTLLEVIIAISILTFGLLAVATMQTTAIRGNYNANCITEATTVGQDRLEELLGLPYGDADLSDPAGGGATDHPDPPTPTAAVGYTINYTVESDTPVTNSKLIRLTVSWQDKGVQKQTVLTCVKPQM
jgi:prepilin-type N-terminal cleavage/methylation domain-containing protein